MINQLLAIIYTNLSEEFRVRVRITITWLSVSLLLGMGKTDGKFPQWRSCPITQQFPC
jgi:hypothetical protein